MKGNMPINVKMIPKSSEKIANIFMDILLKLIILSYWKFIEFNKCSFYIKEGEVLKKLFIGLTIVVCILSACSKKPESEADWQPSSFDTVNSLDGVTMSTKPGTATATGLTVTIDNRSNERLLYGQYFTVEKKNGGSWYEVPILEDAYSFIDLGHNVEAQKTVEWEVDWEGYYGILDSGEYRILKDFRNSEAGTDDETYHLAAEFTVQ